MPLKHMSVGVCSQDISLREKFTGTPEKVVNLFRFVVTEVREILASLGFKSVNEIIEEQIYYHKLTKVPQI